VAPVFWYTTPSLGGYGFPPSLISTFLIATGTLQAMWTLFLFPSLQRRLGSATVLKMVTVVFPVFYGLTPGTVWTLRHHQTTLFWVSTSILQVAYSFAGISTVAIQLAISDVSPGPEVLGTLNSLALATVSGIRAIVPALFGTIYATTVEMQLLDGYLVWVILTVLSLLLVVKVCLLPPLN